MKHIHKFLSLALALVLCLSLAACGDEAAATTMTTIFTTLQTPLRGWSRTVSRCQICMSLAARGGARTAKR